MVRLTYQKSVVRTKPFNIHFSHRVEKRLHVSLTMCVRGWAGVRRGRAGRRKKEYQTFY